MDKNVKYEDLVERVGWGEEFLFQYRGKEYWISQNAEGRYLTRVEDEYSQGFRTTQELFDKAQIDGNKILQIWDQIKDQF